MGNQRLNDVYQEFYHLAVDPEALVAGNYSRGGFISSLGFFGDLHTRNKKCCSVPSSN